MQRIIDKSDLLVLVRGKGLLNAIVVNDSPESSTAWDICVDLMHNGLLANQLMETSFALRHPLPLQKHN